MNVDAGVLGGIGSGLGAIFRDSQGRVLTCGVAQFREVWDPSIAEAKALHWGLKMALQLGFRSIVAEGECKRVI